MSTTTTKKFDRSTIEFLIEQIEKASKKRTAKKAIKLDLRANNIIKAINPEFSHDLTGEWNGYGYTKLGKHLLSAHYAEVKKELKKLLKKAVYGKWRYKEEKTEEKIQKWAERLAKLTLITLDEALDIAYEKIEFKVDKLFDSMNYECSGWKIPAWKKKAERDYDRIAGIGGDRSKALDRIEDEGHAQAILIASRRHNLSDYDEKLQEAKELLVSGELNDKVDIKDWARQNMKY